jgi:hypothetical protein
MQTDRGNLLPVFHVHQYRSVFKRLTKLFQNLPQYRARYSCICAGSRMIEPDSRIRVSVRCPASPPATVRHSYSYVRIPLAMTCCSAESVSTEVLTPKASSACSQLANSRRCSSALVPVSTRSPLPPCSCRCYFVAHLDSFKTRRRWGHALQ